ncbi:hypothetical protein AYO20_08379 [Fonsecaea nubica]|uniref:ATP synthase subunit delta, mitochondrial n=1 Tax=Fonsecaea nubica TaxID=856822 RepID=A0A178CPC5_9EURO|nr:hypothetical protein AYO20_08379 [Fonsecaea nubica]OAL31144.1 hypothetical protein AYO20_08379 [Fonsecaea nubica]
MSALRLSRAALRARSTIALKPIQRRGYAEAVSDKIKLSLALPHQVNIPAESGEMGILAQHVPSIEQLKPGLVEIIEESGGSKQFFLSGGFAVVQPDSVLSINAVEGFPLEDFSEEAVKSQIAEAQKIASGSGSEQDIAEAKIELEVLESLQAAMNPQGGTVANRVRVFQAAQQLETSIPPFSLPPRALDQAKGFSAIAADIGRNSSLASSARRTFGDSSEGILAEGRPGAASIFHKGTKGHEQGDNHEIFPLRPFTSMDGPDDERSPARRPALRQVAHQVHRHRSMENVANDPALEITMARSRLRSVAPKQQSNREEPSRGRSHTMDELNNMLDDAIKNSSPKPDVPPNDQHGNLAPKAGFVLRRASARQDRRPSQSRQRSTRRSTESVVPRSSEESMRVEYEGRKETEDQRQADLSSKQTHKPESPAAPQLKPEAVPTSELSPVKQRAALFESLSQKLTEHDRVCQHFGHEHEPSHPHSHHPPPPRKEIKKIHRIKFGDTIEERPGTPLIPLTLPTLVTQEKTSRPPSTLKKEYADAERPGPTGEGAASDDVFQEDRKPSLSWPFRWSIFNKGTSAPPQETEGPSGTAEAKDEHYPSTRESIVRSKVKDLLQAANEKDDAEQRRRHDEKGRLSRRSTRTQPPQRQTETSHDETRQEKTAEPTSMQTPKKEGFHNLKILAETSDNKPTPRTPLQRAMSEKQVLAPPAPIDPESESGSSPRKPPHTPIRGRSISTHRPVLGEQKRSVQQQFSLSPGPGRSGSKQRQGVKVEVEIRDSPEREARDRGDKIVIIRADVSEMDDDR